MTDYKNKIKALAERNRLATTDEERAAVAAEMNALRREDEQAFTEALEGLIKMTAEDVQEMRMANRLGDIADVEKITDMKKRMRDIYLAVSWREISRTYFDKSVSWFQQKMYGIDGNGGVGGFTPEEAENLYCALNDLADRIRHAADNIKAPATNAPFN